MAVLVQRPREERKEPSANQHATQSLQPVQPPYFRPFRTGRYTRIQSATCVSASGHLGKSASVKSMIPPQIMIPPPSSSSSTSTNAGKKSPGSGRTSPVNSTQNTNSLANRARPLDKQKNHRATSAKLKKSPPLPPSNPTFTTLPKLNPNIAPLVTQPPKFSPPNDLPPLPPATTPATADAANPLNSGRSASRTAVIQKHDSDPSPDSNSLNSGRNSRASMTRLVDRASGRILNSSTVNKSPKEKEQKASGKQHSPETQSPTSPSAPAEKNVATVANSVAAAATALTASPSSMSNMKDMGLALGIGVIEAVVPQKLAAETAKIAAQDKANKAFFEERLKKNEEATAAEFEKLKSKKGADFTRFLSTFPKGGNIHCHLQGEAEFESLVNIAKKYNLWLNCKTFSFMTEKKAKQQNDAEAKKEAEDKSVAKVLSSPKKESEKVRIPAKDLGNLSHVRIEQTLRKRMNMSGCEENSMESLDHFHNAFEVSNSIMKSVLELGVPLSELMREMLLPILKDALKQGIQDIEMMCELLPTNELPKGFEELVTGGNYQAALDLLKSSGWLKAYVESQIKEVKALNKLLSNDMGFDITCPKSPINLRLQVEVWRIIKNPDFFAQVAGGMALNIAYPDEVVAFNVDGPEHSLAAIENFDFMKKVIPFLDNAFEKKANIIIHAGEASTHNSLFMSTGSLRNHIKDSVLAGANRIGHGTSVALEDSDIFKIMRDRRVAVEILLTSNQRMLGEDPETHAIHTYLEQNVPVVLGTDDRGILGNPPYSEFMKAIDACKLSYQKTKEIARNSVEYLSARGESIFDIVNNQYVLKKEFIGCQDPNWVPTLATVKILNSGPKAWRQIMHERALAHFDETKPWKLSLT